MPKLEVLVGQIGVGKSTYSRTKPHHVIVNDDAIVMAVHGGKYGLYCEKLKPLYKSIEHTIIQNALQLGFSVLVDRPCHKRDTRIRYVQLAKSLDCLTECIVFPRKPWREAATQRFNKDNRGMTLQEWMSIAESHEKVFEEVTESEGFDWIHYLPSSSSSENKWLSKP